MVSVAHWAGCSNCSSWKREGECVCLCEWDGPCKVAGVHSGCGGVTPTDSSGGCSGWCSSCTHSLLKSVTQSWTRLRRSHSVRLPLPSHIDLLFTFWAFDSAYTPQNYVCSVIFESFNEHFYFCLNLLWARVLIGISFSSLKFSAFDAGLTSTLWLCEWSVLWLKVSDGGKKSSWSRQAKCVQQILMVTTLCVR